MKYLQAFYARVMANKVLAGMGLAFMGSLAALRWPWLYGWLPPGLQKQIADTAYYTAGTMLSGLFFWVKTHGNVGDPAAQPKTPDVGKENKPDGISAPLIIAIGIIGLALAGCTAYDLGRGTGYTMGDSQGFTQTHGRDSIHWDNMSHSVVWDASGRFLGNVSAGVADALIAHGVGRAVQHGAVNGVQLIAATVPSATQKVASRRTNRITPAPAIKP